MIKIGELSNLTNTSIQTIRYYESEGLIKPIEVDKWTNYRYYNQGNIKRLCEIKIINKIRLTENFNKTDLLFQVGTILLPFIFLPILAFSDKKYTFNDKVQQNNI